MILHNYLATSVLTEKIIERPEPDAGSFDTPATSFPLEDFAPNLNTHLGVIGVNFKTAPISAREQLARTISLEKLRQLKNRKVLSSDVELILLSTCNRIEVYFATENLKQVIDPLRSLFLTVSSSMPIDFRTYQNYDGQAIEHIFTVAAGLDSLVIGEAQILSQVGEACRKANENGLCGPTLSKLFSKAFSVGREIRESYPKLTSGFRNSVSLSVLNLIQRYFEDWSDIRPNLLLVGSGKMIRLAIDSLNRSQLGKIIVAARRKELKDFKADRVVSITEIGRIIAEENIDVVITATSAENYVLSPSDLNSYSKQLMERRLLIVDISVPRNVDPRITATSKNIILLNLDDLKEQILQTRPSPGEAEERAGQLSSIRSSILARTSEFISWMKENSDVSPLMNALRRKAETIRSEEIENAFARLSDLTPDQRKVIMKMSERIIRRFLHEPTIKLKELARNIDANEPKEFASALSELFSLDLDKKDSHGKDDSAGK